LPMTVKTTTLFIIVSLFLTGCAAREDILTLDDSMASVHQRMAMLERENVDMKNRLASLLKTEEGKTESFQGKTAEIKASHERLTEELQSLRGKMEETQFLLKPADGDQKEREARLIALEKGLQEQRDRIKRLEGYLNLESPEAKTSGTPPPPVTPKAEPSKMLSENETYAEAKQAFDRGEFEKARTRFQELLKNYPASINADNAQFWIGESYYREKWYEKAILEYQKVVEKYPTGNKVQASLLKQGLSFQNLGDTANARLILKELVRKYPTANEAKIAQQKLKEIP